MNRLMLLAAVPAFFLLSCSDSTQPPADNFPIVDNAPPAPKSGRVLFMDNCSQCHRVERDLTGPALSGVLARWNNDTAKLVRFVHNSQKVIREGDAYANELYEKWSKTQMPANTHLSETEVRSILDYIAGGHD